LIFVHFLLCVASFVVSNSAVDCPNRLLSEMTVVVVLSVRLEITVLSSMCLLLY